MKKFLQSLQSIQDECIDGIKKLKVNQLPEKVAGANVHSVNNHISFEEWDMMRENITQHTKEWRRFKNDPNKVVLEKNFFINCLSFVQGFYIFRSVNNEGKTYIKINDCFFDSKPEESELRSLAPTILLIIIIFASCFLSMFFSNYFFIGLVLLPVPFVIQKKNNKHLKAREKEWQKSFTGHPGKILSHAVFSKKKTIFAGSTNLVLEKNVRESLVKISLDKSPFFDDYQAILNKTLDIAKQTKGQVAWLWQLGRHSLLEDDFSVTYNDFIGRHLDQTLCININVKSSNILPIIETEHSFIFCLDNFSNEMEQYYLIPDGIIETLSKKTKNSTGTVINDDLFRLNEI